MNVYYNFRVGDTIVPFTRARAQEVADQFTAVAEGFDKIAARAIQVPEGEPPMVFPSLTARAGKLPVWNYQGGFVPLEAPNTVVALDANSKPYGLSIYEVLSEIGIQIQSEGIWQKETQVMSEANWQPDTPIVQEGVWG